ncbi:stage II sporulation protein R [Clostridium fermenticellae]|uniref:Stage II sporulation protein R n=1 Tax=Clostridium fermenticellae TaxID=2068654 RepID=A0A386H0G7_9CLOT|nr:stage II sporulation protein R [Clostridium fermenticellae]AYD39177.1 stage II sporulation protein R [Clostridium fermenticellae]
MRRVLNIFICVIISILVVFGCAFEGKAKSQNLQKDIASKIIRFHVIANSDLGNDQQLKLKVRDKVLQYIQPKLKGSKNIYESRKILLANNDEINKIANDVVKKNGYNYEVKTMLSHENFPVKTYGNITLPQGRYEAYRIIIGSGKGHNWWCVMFPPLCFVDITKGEVSYEETEKDMRKVLTDEEYKSIDNKINSTDKSIKIKFKLLEIIRSRGI